MDITYKVAQHCLCQNLCWSIDISILDVHFGGSLFCCAGGSDRVCGHHMQLGACNWVHAVGSMRVPERLLVSSYLHLWRLISTEAA